MMRSLFAGVSALRNHQVRMDVIGNNIANVNTVGFKASRVSFQDMLSQQMRDAAAPQGSRGGINPMQVGLGATMAAISVNHGQGNVEPTGVETDLAIEGNGYFIVSDGMERYYTRAGMFVEDRQGNLVMEGTGHKVMGWIADEEGSIDTNAAVTNISIPTKAMIGPRAATQIWFGGNLDARVTGTLDVSPNPVTIADADGNLAQLTFKFTPTGSFNEWTWEVIPTNGTITSAAGTAQGTIRLDASGEVLSVTQNTPGALEVTPATDDNSGLPVAIALPAVGAPGGGSFTWAGGTAPGVFTPSEERVTRIGVYDSLGNLHDIITSFRKIGDNEWEWEARDAQGNLLNDSGQADLLRFDTNGRLVAQLGTLSFAPPGADAVSIRPDFSAMRQMADESTAQSLEQDGYGAGTLKGFSIDARGVVNGAFSNGLNRQLAQIALVSFGNPAALFKVGNNLYAISNNSGEPQVGVAGEGELGELRSGALEMSNVDLSQEFTNMIITQRGFQANSRIITTSDEMLQELVNLKR